MKKALEIDETGMRSTGLGQRDVEGGTNQRVRGRTRRRFIERGELLPADGFEQPGRFGPPLHVGSGRIACHGTQDTRQRRLTAP